MDLPQTLTDDKSTCVDEKEVKKGIFFVSLPLTELRALVVLLGQMWWGHWCPMDKFSFMRHF